MREIYRGRKIQKEYRKNKKGRREKKRIVLVKKNYDVYIIIESNLKQISMEWMDQAHLFSQ